MRASYHAYKVRCSPKLLVSPAPARTRARRSSRSKLHATNIHSSTMLLQLDYISQVQFTLESKVSSTIISTVCIVEFQRVTSVGKLVKSPARRRRTSTTHGSADTQTQLCKLRRLRDRTHKSWIQKCQWNTTGENRRAGRILERSLEGGM